MSFKFGLNLLKGVGDFFALDFGTSSIRLVQLEGDTQHGWSLSKFAYVPVDPKILQDDSELGQRKRAEVVLGAIQQAGITTKNVAVGLPAGKTYTAIVELPAQNQDDLEKTIQYQLDKYIPMPIEEAQTDYVLLGPSPKNQELSEVLISSASKKYTEDFLEGVEAIGLNIIAQEPEPLAMARALMPVGVPDARLILDLGERSTDIVMVYNGAPRLVRSIPGGFQSFIKTTASALSVREDQARQFILKFGLAQDKLEGQVYKTLSVSLETFVSEITKSIKFFQDKYTNAQVGGIIISGFAGIIPFIAEYIETKAGVPTAQGNPWQLVRVTPEQQQLLQTVANEFAVAIGLAERSNEKSVRD